MVNYNTIKTSLLVFTTCLISISTFSQERVGKTMNVRQLFDLTIAHNPSLAVTKSRIGIASQQVEEAKSNRLPNLTTSLSGFYIGDAYVIEKDFSNSTKVNIPDFGNAFSIDASQLIWNNGLIRKGIELKTLQEQITELDYLSSEQNIKLLTLSYYLDLYKMNNQAEVYRKNIELAEQRYDNINRFFEQGMVTRNDVIRGELQISNLKLSLQVVENNAEINNQQLIVALGLDKNTVIVPDDEVLEEKNTVSVLNDYIASIGTHPNLLMAQKNIDIYQVIAESTKAGKAPTLSAFAGNTLQRPITTSSPALDMFSNGWQVGLSLNYNIASLYKNPKVLKRNKLEIKSAKLKAFEVEQMMTTSVKAAYIKYNEAVFQSNTLRTNEYLADENYRIMEMKYNNQLAILLDLIDASNAKLDAELQYTNAEINILYSYYKLLRESGQL